MDTAVGLVESYLRLNGYLTATELQVQERVRRRPDAFETATDLDILAVHLPWAAHTAPGNNGSRDPQVVIDNDPDLSIATEVPDIIIGEVKEGTGALNRRLRTSGVLHGALRRSGCCPPDHIDAAVAQLVDNGAYRPGITHGTPCRIRLASFCGRPGEPLAPQVLVITLDHIVQFIATYLTRYHEQVRSAQFRDPILGTLKLLYKMGLLPMGSSQSPLVEEWALAPGNILEKA